MSKVPGIGDLFKQAQDLQERLQRVQAEAGERTVEASAGGGMVRATVNGRLEVLRLQIEPGALEGGDVEMLQDLVLTAVNEATRKVEAAVQEKVGALTGGLKLPGM